jgi:hypothetical protein
MDIYDKICKKLIKRLMYCFHVYIILSCIKGIDKNTTKQAINDFELKGVFFYQDVNYFMLYFENYANSYSKSKM